MWMDLIAPPFEFARRTARYNIRILRIQTYALLLFVASYHIGASFLEGGTYPSCNCAVFNPNPNLTFVYFENAIFVNGKK